MWFKAKAHRRRLAIVLIAGLPCAAGLLLVHRYAAQPMPRAVCLNRNFGKFLPFHQWVSDRAVLTRYHVGKRGLCIVDVTTGAETPLQAFNKRWPIHLPLHDRRFESYSGRFFGSLSPDGKTFYWQDRFNTDDLGAGDDVPRVASLDGRSGARLPSDVYNEIPWLPNGWTPDGQGWIDIERDNRGHPDTLTARIYRHTPPVTFRDVPIPAPAVPASQKGLGDRYRCVLGFTAEGRIIARTEYRDENNSLSRLGICLLEFGIEPDAAPPKEYRIPYGTGSYGQEADLSPRGDRLAWVQRVLSAREPPLFLRPLVRWLPFLGRSENGIVREELWVSRRDGSARHRLGYYQQELSGKYRGMAIENPQWMPDDKHVAFIYQGGLYRIPAD